MLVGAAAYTTGRLQSLFAIRYLQQRQYSEHKALERQLETTKRALQACLPQK